MTVESETTLKRGLRTLTPTTSAVADGGRVRLRTLNLIRWIAVGGQSAALAIVYVGLEYPLPIVPAMLLVLVAVAVNLQAAWSHRGAPWLTDRGAAVYLAGDLVQLSALLALTGGLANPFALLILAPVTVSASVLSRSSTLVLAGLAIVAASVLAVWHVPLPWGNGGLDLPSLYIGGIWVALVLAVGFIAAYVFSLAAEAQRMSDALSATQMALAREQRLSALGGLAAAAAHELGSPLGTIAVVAREKRARRLDGDDVGVGLLIESVLRDAHQRPGGPTARDDRPDLAVEGVVDLRPGRLVVGLDVQRGRELLGDDRVVVASDDLLGALDRPFHVVLRGGVDDLRAERAHERLFLDAELLRDDEHGLDVVLRRGQRHPDPRVPGRRLDDLSAGFDLPRIEQVLDDVLPDAVLDAGARVERFQFRVDRNRLRARLYVDHRRVADGFEHRRVRPRRRPGVLRRRRSAGRVL